MSDEHFLIYHREQARWICDVLNARFPNITFSIPVGFERQPRILAQGYRGALSPQTTQAINEAISILVIAWNTPKGVSTQEER